MSPVNIRQNLEEINARLNQLSIKKVEYRSIVVPVVPSESDYFNGLHTVQSLQRQVQIISELEELDASIRTAIQLTKGRIGVILTQYAQVAPIVFIKSGRY